MEAADAEAHFSPVSLMDLLPNDVNEFWRYSGSLTTPTCDEVVIWTVFKNKVTLSKHQLEKFFHLKTEDGEDLKNNFRPVLPLNDRVVYFANLELHCHADDAFDWQSCETCGIEHRCAVTYLPII